MSEKSGNKKRIRIIPLFVSIIIPLLIGWLSTLLVPNMRSIYESLIKPPFSPPAMVFPIVWTILYIIMGICSYKVYILKYENVDVSSAIFVYAIQLLLNFLWTIIFFGFKLYALAFLELIILIIFVILTIKRFYEKIGNKTFLLIPYLAWLVYAGVLNFFIWMLNEM
ncbi:MAG: tryptophan-rich sensory protein [Clostridium beijerinckii]|nr:tryptophan-rich sensory protein [Clostridium beijerinckii]